MIFSLDLPMGVDRLAVASILILVFHFLLAVFGTGALFLVDFVFSAVDRAGIGA